MSEENYGYENSNEETQYTQAPVTEEPVYSGETTDYSSGKGQGKGFGIASMVCGIIALITCCMWCTCIPLAVVSIVLGILQIVKNESKGMAIAGIICSAVALILLIGLTIYGNYLESTGVYNEFMQEFMKEYSKYL